MLHRVILAGLSACVLALTFGFSQTANAQTKYCWIDAKTGEGVPTVPIGITREELHSLQIGDHPNQAHGAGAHDYVRVPCPTPIFRNLFPSTSSSAIGGGNPVLVLGGNLGGGWSRNSYSDFPTFDGSGAGGGVYGVARFNIQPGFFIGPEGGFMLLNINARNPDSAFGFVRTDAYLGGQAGVTLQGPGASKINLYTGLDADWSRVTVGVSNADERMSKVLGGWSVHGGIEVQPNPSIPNLWLGLDLRHSDVSGTIGVDPTHVRWNMLTVTLSIQH
jgi:hypothetical protein